MNGLQSGKSISSEAATYQTAAVPCGAPAATDSGDHTKSPLPTQTFENLVTGCCNLGSLVCSSLCEASCLATRRRREALNPRRGDAPPAGLQPDTLWQLGSRRRATVRDRADARSGLQHYAPPVYSGLGRADSDGPPSEFKSSDCLQHTTMVLDQVFRRLKGAPSEALCRLAHHQCETVQKGAKSLLKCKMSIPSK